MDCRPLFLCIDYYLERDDILRKNQVKVALDKWNYSFNSEQLAKEWGGIIKSEDTPSTLSLIISTINDCDSVIPLLSSKRGVMATIYGMTKLDMEKLNELELSEYVSEAKKDLGNENLIDAYPFD